LFAGRGTWASRPHLSLWHDNSPVNCVAFSPDGQTVATGTGDGLVRLWRVSDGALLHTLEGHTRPVGGVAFAQQGALLVSGSRDGNVNVWRVSDGTLLDQITDRSSEIFGLAVSPDDELLAVGGLEAAWIWRVNAESFTRVDYQRYPSGAYVNGVAFSPDSTLLALALSDDTVWLRRVSDGEIVLRLGNHTGRVLSLAFSPDGEYLATGSEDGTLNLWRLERKADGEFGATLVLKLQHSNWVNSLAFSPDGTILATATMDRNVRLWSVPDGGVIEPPLHSMPQVTSVSFSPDGRTLAVGTGGGNLRLWRISEPSGLD
jgi:WD40 repeat protein